MIEWDRWPDFTEDEFLCNCGCGRADMNPDFMDQLQHLRNLFGRPIVINSGFRCPEYNAQVSSTGRDGPHTTGRAVDIGISGRMAHTLLRYVMELDFTGVGIAQKGDHAGRFIHLDNLESGPRPWVWSY